MNLSIPLTVKTADDSLEEKTLGSLLSESPKTLLYFYPKDNTPGCTTEAQDFTALKQAFESLGVHIVGVSRDSVESHKQFTVSCALGIDLISDTSEALHHAFGVIGEKNNYGKIAVGVIRSTFLLDNLGKVIKEWRNVKATGHASKILQSLQS